MLPPNINSSVKITNENITSILDKIKTNPNDHGKIYKNTADGTYYYKIKPEKKDRALSINQMIQEFITLPHSKGEKTPELKERIQAIKALIERKQEKIDKLGVIRRFFVELFKHSISQNSKDRQKIEELETVLKEPETATFTKRVVISTKRPSLYVEFQEVTRPLSPEEIQLSQNIKTLTEELLSKLEKREKELPANPTSQTNEQVTEKRRIGFGKAMLTFYSEICDKIMKEYPSWKKWKENVQTKKATTPWTKELANETGIFLYSKLKISAHPIYFDQKVIDQSIEQIIVDFPEILLRTLEKIAQEESLKDQLQAYYDLYLGDPCLNARVSRITEYLVAPNLTEIDVTLLLTKSDNTIVQELYDHFTTQCLIKFAQENQIPVSKEIFRFGSLSRDYQALLKACVKNDDFFNQENFSEQSFIKFINKTVPNKFPAEEGKVHTTIHEALKELLGHMDMTNISPFSKTALGVE